MSRGASAGQFSLGLCPLSSIPPTHLKLIPKTRTHTHTHTHTACAYNAARQRRACKCPHSLVFCASLVPPKVSHEEPSLPLHPYPSSCSCSCSCSFSFCAGVRARVQVQVQVSCQAQGFVVPGSASSGLLGPEEENEPHFGRGRRRRRHEILLGDIVWSPFRPCARSLLCAFKPRLILWGSFPEGELVVDN